MGSHHPPLPALFPSSDRYRPAICIQSDGPLIQLNVIHLNVNSSTAAEQLKLRRLQNFQGNERQPHRGAAVPVIRLTLMALGSV